MNTPLAKYLADKYLFRFQDEQVDVLMERLHEVKTGDLTAEIEVRCSRDAPNALIHQTRLNLISTRSRADVIRALGNRIPESQIDWTAALEYTCHLAIKHWREGDPVLDMWEIEPGCGPRFLLDPYVERGGATILFADGGLGKSLFGLAIAYAVASGIPIIGRAVTAACPVLYLDWEADGETHRDRLHAIAEGAGLGKPPNTIHYRRQYASLAEVAPHVRRIIAEEHIGFVVVDSLGAARGGEPESADTTIRLFNGARSWEVPWTGIDHVTKNGGDGQAKPFGSVYTHNLARLTWSMEKVEEQSDGMMIALTNHKSNNGRLKGRRAYSVQLRQDENERPTWIHYESTDPRELPNAFADMKNPQRIAEILRRNGKLELDDIGLALTEAGYPIKEDTLRVALYQHPKEFSHWTAGGKTWWGLLATNAPL